MNYTIELSEHAERVIAAVAALHGVTPDEYIQQFITAWAAELTTDEELDPEQAWFWAPEWQAGERKADADYATGRTTHYDSDEAFLKALEEHISDATETPDADS
ncbi:MAG: hypothetical protein OJF49_002140 [Ktedonobacterales bacterium]|jgi:hypothetical protein|nr:MAG: hypothetical protein OJF49_002140 [Ktedonobacterales bacterium]